MISIGDLKQFVPEWHLSDENWQRMLDGELLYLEREAPDAPDNAERDLVLVDLIKNRLAYRGLASLSEAGVTTAWRRERANIVRHLATENPL